MAEILFWFCAGVVAALFIAGGIVIWIGALEAGHADWLDPHGRRKDEHRHEGDAL